MPTLPQSDSSERLSSNTELTPSSIEVLSENSLSRLSETTPSTPAPTPKKRGRPPGSVSRKAGQLPQNWKPGQSGNPVGRPKGTKNQITVLKEALELKLRDRAKWKIEKVLDKAIELALLGDRLMIKLLLEMHMSKTAHQEDTTTGKTQVAVVIQNLTNEDGSNQGKVIDVTPIEVSKE